MIDAQAIIDRLKAASGVTTDAALARELGITRGSVSLWKKHNAVPLHHAVAISERYGVSIDWIVTGISTEPVSDTFFEKSLHVFPTPNKDILSIAVMEFMKINNLDCKGISENKSDMISNKIALFYENNVIRYASLSSDGALSHEEKISILRRPFWIEGEADKKSGTRSR